MVPVSKTINLNDCSLSAIKPYLDSKYDLQGKSYFELYIKSRDYRSILLFGWKEEFTQPLYEYVTSFRELQSEIADGEKELKVFIANESSTLNTMENFLAEKNNFNTEYQTNKKNQNMNIFQRDQKYMSEIISKLEGKFINQKNWEKDCIKVINQTSNEIEYEEAWVELENGSNYSGPVKNGMPHGYGKEYRPDGSLYTGYFFEGKWHGPGTITNETLDTYNGEFIDGCICGI
jgi:hypothetical protein